MAGSLVIRMGKGDKFYIEINALLIQIEAARKARQSKEVQSLLSKINESECRQNSRKD